MSSKIKFSDWFDPKNKEHLAAYRHLREEAIWPKDFRPDSVCMDRYWEEMIKHKMIEELLDLRLGRKEPKQGSGAFVVGDRVSRPLYLDDGTWARDGDQCLSHSPLRKGFVASIRTVTSAVADGSIMTDEVIDVLWDNGQLCTYLPTGVDRIE